MIDHLSPRGSRLRVITHVDAYLADGGLPVLVQGEGIDQGDSNACGNIAQGEFGAGSPIGPLIHRGIGRVNAEG